MDQKSCTNGIAISGLCPGGSNFKCCIPNNKNNTNKKKTNNKTTNNTKNKTLSGTWNCKDHSVCKSALNQVGSDKWSPSKKRTVANNNKVIVPSGQPKCNLFVYEMLLDNGIDIGTPNRGRNGLFSKTPRPPLADDWYDFKDKINKKDSQLKTYFNNIESKNESRPGDIIVSEKHIGIVSQSNKYCISASYNEKIIVNNDWGFTRGGPVKFYRLKDDYLRIVCPNCFT